MKYIKTDFSTVIFVTNVELDWMEAMARLEIRSLIEKSTTTDLEDNKGSWCNILD